MRRDQVLVDPAMLALQIQHPGTLVCDGDVEPYQPVSIPRKYPIAFSRTIEQRLQRRAQEDGVDLPQSSGHYDDRVGGIRSSSVDASVPYK